jgi:hypothetical protein
MILHLSSSAASSRREVHDMGDLQEVGLEFAAQADEARGRGQASP